MDMITLGDLDFLTTLKTEEELFGLWIDDWIQIAVRGGEATAEPYKRWCKIAAFDVDVDTEPIMFIGWLPERDELRKLLSLTGSSFISTGVTQLNRRTLPVCSNMTNDY